MRALEIIFDYSYHNVVGFKELDPTTLVKAKSKYVSNNNQNIWIQYPNDDAKKRVLLEDQIIFGQEECDIVESFTKLPMKVDTFYQKQTILNRSRKLNNIK